MSSVGSADEKKDQLLPPFNNISSSFNFISLVFSLP